MAYMIFGLHGESAVTLSFFIPTILATSVLSPVVAVAFNANMFTLLATRLRTSPILVIV